MRQLFPFGRLVEQAFQPATPTFLSAIGGACFSQPMKVGKGGRL